MNPRAALKRLSTPVKRTGFGERLVRRNPLWYPAAARRFTRLAAATLRERRDWDARELRRALAVAARTAYGRRVGAPAALGDWPTLAPAALRGNPREVVRGGWSLPSATGGTTGVPLPLWRSPRSVAVEQAAIDHLLSAHGVDPARARVCVLRGDDVKDPADRTPPFWIDAADGRRRIFSSNHLAADTLPAYVEALRAFHADYWWVYPTTLEALLRRLAEAGLELRVPLVLASSELLSPAVSATARATLGCAVVDYYGQAERVAFAWCDAPGAWRFLPGYAHVELLDRSDDGDGPCYEIVGTPFWNEAMPLVRYRTGDVVRFETPLDGAALEEVALGVRTFPGVLGRDNDILIAPDGTRLTGIDHFHRGVDRVLRIQVVHERPDLVRVLVLPAAGFGERERGEILANARRKLPPSMRVEVEVADALERTALGKTPFVVWRPGVPAPARAGAR